MSTSSEHPAVSSAFRVLHVSDSHLSRTGADSAVSAWTDIVRYTEWSRPDLVIHTGDAVRDDPDAEDDHEFAAFQLRRLSVPWRIVPGNHDIGDTEPDPYRGRVTGERLDRYRRHFGADRWSVELGRWLLIGLDSQIFDDELLDEQIAQWEWFDETIAGHPQRHIAIFLHKPPCLTSLSEDLVANKTINPAARARLRDLAEAGRLKLIAAGHLHEFTTFTTFGATVVIAPSTGTVRPSTATRALGLRCNGAVEYQFHDDGFRYQLRFQDELREGSIGVAPAGTPA